MRVCKTSLLACATLIFVASSANAQNSLRSAPPGAELIPNQYICVFSKAYVQSRNAQAEAERIAGPAGGQVGRTYSHSVRGFSVHIAEQGVRRMLVMNPNIAYCEQDQVMRLEPQKGPPPRKGRSGSAADGGQTTPWGVKRVHGGVAGASGSAFIIDTGIDADHPDLNVDASRSASFGENSDWNDNHGHGTHVAGTVAAVDNSEGVIGVAPGAKVVAVRVLERDGTGSYSNVIAGVDYVARVGKAGEVANMSLGGLLSQALDDAVLTASERVKFTIAAGNDSLNANIYSPARVSGPNIYTVSAFREGDLWATFSNWGNPPIDFGEPGQSILSTWKDGGYMTISGTSMAAPHLAGVLLLGAPKADGTVSGDPDLKPDPIGAH